jgi:hypothetical protein
MAISGLLTASLLAGMVGAQMSAARLAGSAAPVRVVRQAHVTQQHAPPAPAPRSSDSDVERE